MAKDRRTSLIALTFYNCDLLCKQNCKQFSVTVVEVIETLEYQRKSQPVILAGIKEGILRATQNPILNEFLNKTTNTTVSQSAQISV